MTDATGDGGYFAADYETDEELARLRVLESLCDPWTIRFLDAVGVAPGWSCLEVGAGAGSVARWLAERVGPSGHVVATDLNPRFLDGLSASGIDVRRLDITADDIEPGRYDLVHSRALVLHLADPVGALRRMVAALRPGGRLAVEEPDYSTTAPVDRSHPLAAGYAEYLNARTQFLAEANVMNLHYGSMLPVHVEQLGLTGVVNEGRLTVERGGSPQALFLMQSFQQVDDLMVVAGVLPESAVAAAWAALQDPTFAYRSATMHKVWGRRP
jgi:SAM-dependent methyltransferase